AKPRQPSSRTAHKFDLVINLTTAKALGIAIPNNSYCLPTLRPKLRTVARRSFSIASDIEVLPCLVEGAIDRQRDQRHEDDQEKDGRAVLAPDFTVAHVCWF